MSNANGNLPDNVLKVVGPTTIESGEQKLNNVAANDWEKMKKAALDAGITLTIDQGYRKLGSPKKGCAEGFTQWCAWKTYKSGGNKAAPPGTSNHGWGSAIDLAINNDPELDGKDYKQKKEIKKTKLDWLKNNASKFGFKATVAGEEWHYDHLPSISVMKSGNYGEVENVEEPKKEEPQTPQKPPNYDLPSIDISAPQDKTAVRFENFIIEEELDRIKDLIKKIL